MKDLGAATAYAYAVEEGYTGTEEEFAALMADFTTAAETATAAAEAAEAAAASLTVDDELDDESTNPVQNAVITNELSSVKDGFDDLDDRVTALEQGGTGGGLTEDIKQALLQIASKVAYIDDDGQDYYDDLYNALYPPVGLDSISAVYTQSVTVYNTDTLDSLKTDLVVTAYYDDSTSETVTAYTLSGSLTVGTSTITVAYGGKTTTFTVTVTEYRGIPENYTWLYDARNGELLSEQDYVTKSNTGTVSETLSNNVLVAHADNNGTSSGSTAVYLSYSLTDTTATSAIITTRAKLTYTPDITQGSSAIGTRLQLSNGTNGAQVYFEHKNDKISVDYLEGSTRKKIDTDFAVSDYHIFELKLENNAQTFSIDGSQVFTSSTLSTSYATYNLIRIQASNSSRCPNGVTTEFDWITYYEVS